MTLEEQKVVDAARRLQLAYRAAFAHPAAQEALHDLTHYCRAGLSPVPETEKEPFDINRSLILLGRQQVWLRIERFLNLQPSQLYAVYSRRSFNLESDDAT